jgi:hypothetical protein
MTGQEPGAPIGTADEERRVGSSPRGAAVNAAFLAFARAARSFTLYDHANQVVRTLIGDYREKMQAALAAGPIELDVRPFELWLGAELVYTEADRERSLAFRLFRDGVRGLRITPEVAWEELLKLLEIFSIRYTGVRQQEDDLVTLLRKAGFRGLSLVAVEGFVPDEERPESVLEPDPGGATGRRAPPEEWDLPLPRFGPRGDVRYVDVDPALRAALAAEEEEAGLADQAVEAVRGVLGALPAAAREPALAFAGEVRDFLVLEQRGEALLALGTTLVDDAERNGLDGTLVLRRFLDSATLEAILLAESRRADEPSPGLARLLSLASGPHLECVLRLLEGESAVPRPLLEYALSLVAAAAPAEVPARALKASGPTAVALLRILERSAPERAAGVALELSNRPDLPTQAAALDVLSRVPLEKGGVAALRHLLESAHAAIRVRASAVLVERGGARAWPLLEAHAAARGAALETGEAEALGEALARCSPQHAIALFEDWLHAGRPRGLLGRIATMAGRVPRPHQEAALAGLRALTGAPALALLGHLAAHADEDLRVEAQALLAGRAG